MGKLGHSFKTVNMNVSRSCVNARKETRRCQATPIEVHCISQRKMVPSTDVAAVHYQSARSLYQIVVQRAVIFTNIRPLMLNKQCNIVL
ncbi:hypothetical protein PVAP13_4NG261100 [Panicum virgatum]|uniref:Uncharacterized protein n=1 Tax=Panicum virgatum TaxID=38727 RepID=A0A8T0T882_PANVG|nr:hypothetical protein PVAP13_4NG261100 [Panicum virgatum]